MTDTSTGWLSGPAAGPVPTRLWGVGVAAVPVAGAAVAAVPVVLSPDPETFSSPSGC